MTLRAPSPLSERVRGPHLPPSRWLSLKQEYTIVPREACAHLWQVAHELAELSGDRPVVAHYATLLTHWNARHAAAHGGGSAAPCGECAHCLEHGVV